MKKWIVYVLILALALALAGCDSGDYKKAQELYSQGQYEEAARMFAALGDYKDSSAMVKASRYQQACQVLERGDYDRAVSLFQELGSYLDSENKILEARYQQAISDYNRGNYEAALERFRALNDYADSAEWIRRCNNELLDKRVGTYTLTDMSVDGVSYSDVLYLLGDELRMVMYADGTGFMQMGEDVLEFTWDAEKLTASDGSVIPYDYDGQTVTVEEEGTVLVFTFASSEPAERPAQPVQSAPSGSVAGTWTGTVDAAEYLVNETPDLKGYLTTAPIAVTLVLTEDGKYTISMDGTTMIPEFKQALRSYFEDYCAENGVTVAQLESYMGKSLDDLIDEALSEQDLSGLFEELSGNYEVSGDKVTFDPGKSGEVVADWIGDTLRFTIDIGEVTLTR